MTHSSLEGQTRYMINESTFQKYLPEFEGRGHNVIHEEVSWCPLTTGWVGVSKATGNRETYAYEYAKKLVKV